MRPMVRALLALPLLVPLLGAAPTASISVTVTGVRNDRGDVRVAICPQADFLAEQCPYNGLAPAHAGAVTVTISGIPPGVYAAQAYHDENRNGEVDRSLLGLPEEGIGFSRDAPINFGPPRFADAAFRLVPGHAAISFRLRYF
jgi:uncharacterized protein (DUF2141 family)